MENLGRSPEPVGILSTSIGVPMQCESLYSVLLCILRCRYRHNFIPRHQSLKRHGHELSTTSVSRVPGNLGSCTRAPAVCLESIYTVYQMQSSHWSSSWTYLLTLLLYGSYMHWNVILYNQVLDCGMFDYEPFFRFIFPRIYPVSIWWIPRSNHTHKFQTKCSGGYGVSQTKSDSADLL